MRMHNISQLLFCLVAQLRSPLGLLSILVFIASTSSAHPISAISIGEIEHWKSLAVVRFLVVNCFAHAATVLLPCGATYREIILLTAVAVVNPYHGAGRALLYISQWLECHSDDIHKALARNGLLVAARNEKWEPTSAPGQWDAVWARVTEEQSSCSASSELRYLLNGSTASLSYQIRPPHRNWRVRNAGYRAVDESQDTDVLVAERKSQPELVDDASHQPSLTHDYPIARFELSHNFWENPEVARRVKYEDHPYHGRISLPEGYDTIFVPLYAGIQMIACELQPTKDLHLNYKLSPLKVIISLFQLLSAIWALYRTRGDQVRSFGFAAYGFIVLPYAFASLLNLVALLFIPDFPGLYLLQSRVLREASRRQEGVIEGAVGQLRDGPDSVAGGRKLVHLRTVIVDGIKCLVMRAPDSETKDRWFRLQPQDHIQEAVPDDSLVFHISHYTDSEISWLEPTPTIPLDFLSSLGRRSGGDKPSFRRSIPTPPWLRDMLGSRAPWILKPLLWLIRLGGGDTSGKAVPHAAEPWLLWNDAKLKYLAQVKVIAQFISFSILHMTWPTMVGYMAHSGNIIAGHFHFLLGCLMTVVMVIAPVLIDYLITHFSAGQSTIIERLFICVWILLNLCGFFVFLSCVMMLGNDRPTSITWYVTFVFSLIIGIGVFWIFSNMMMHDPYFPMSS